MSHPPYLALSEVFCFTAKTWVCPFAGFQIDPIKDTEAATDKTLSGSSPCSRKSSPCCWNIQNWVYLAHGTLFVEGFRLLRRLSFRAFPVLTAILEDRLGVCTFLTEVKQSGTEGNCFSPRGPVSGEGGVAAELGPMSPA